MTIVVASTGYFVYNNNYLEFTTMRGFTSKNNDSKGVLLDATQRRQRLVTASVTDPIIKR
jgi:hypothetical protein